MEVAPLRHDMGRWPVAQVMADIARMGVAGGIGGAMNPLHGGEPGVGRADEAGEKRAEVMQPAGDDVNDLSFFLDQPVHRA